jgi:hypothetical protein
MGRNTWRWQAVVSLRPANLGHLSQRSPARLIRLLEGVVVGDADGVGWPGVAGVLHGASGGVVGREMGDEDDGGRRGCRT